MIQDIEGFNPRFCKNGHDITNPAARAETRQCRICRRAMQISAPHHYKRVKRDLRRRIAQKRIQLEELRLKLDEEED